MKKNNDGWGCTLVVIIGSILMLVILPIVSTCKSCISNSNKGPSYDYYDDRAR